MRPPILLHDLPPQRGDYILEGKIFLRSARNFSTAMYRRIDSRTRSLTGLLCSLLIFFRSALKSSGSLMVSVFIVSQCSTCAERNQLLLNALNASNNYYAEKSLTVQYILFAAEFLRALIYWNEF